MRGSAWPRPKPVIEIVLEGRCPECGGSLDTGWECNYWDCNFDGEQMILAHAASCDRNPKGEKPQALSAKHESAVAATSGETPNSPPSDLSTDKDG